MTRPTKNLVTTVLAFTTLWTFAACGGAPSGGARSPDAEPQPAGPPLSASFDKPEASASGSTPGGPCAASAASTPGAAAPGADSDAPLGSATPIPLSLEGTLVYLPVSARALPDFSTLSPVGKLYATKLDVPPRAFDSGFPGVSERFEWFALDYRGAFSAPVAGSYGFNLLSDDGSKLFIDGKLVIDNDGVHSPAKKSGTVSLAAGPHAIEVQYFQGPRVQIALVLEWKPPGQQDFVVFETKKAALAQVAERPGAVRITLPADVLFDTAKYDLKPDAVEALRVAKLTAIDPRPSGRVTVEGHTDDVGKDASNQTLSENRARSVATWLTSHGVAAARIRTLGYGEKAPRVPNDSPEHRHQNRRVELVVEGCPGK